MSDGRDEFVLHVARGPEHLQVEVGGAAGVVREGDDLRRGLEVLVRVRDVHSVTPRIQVRTV